MLIVCDIDQSIADNSHRVHLLPNWDAFLSPEVVALDKPIPEAQLGISFLQQYHEIIFLTGRNEGLRETTKEWLKKHFNIDTTPNNLLMRPTGSMELPTTFKRKELMRLVYKYPLPWLCIDDDSYMHPIYQEMGCISLLAPDCWNSLMPRFTNLPEESNWRR